MPVEKYSPEWKRFEADIRSDDPKKAREATDLFLETRKKEMAFSKKARDYELSRRERNAKDKPLFVKERLQEEKKNDPMLKFNKEVKNAGVHEMELAPAPGYLVVQIDEMEQKTEAGIYIPTDVDTSMTNTGTVLAVGEGTRMDTGVYVEFPVPVGKKVMFKKGAGIELKIKEKSCRFMQHSDILGFFY